MKLLTGVIFLLIAELAFAHTHLIPFPHHEYVSQTLLPASAAAAILGGLFLLWGVVSELKSSFGATTCSSNENAKHRE
ncbi:MAG: hypothetical protein P8M30_16410 [Planctomycetaceae bacterium]|jgi:hypothetical protein|nr:hypothetical protein [bacterium]MDG2390890.1 hypothetical protein [Planctomycetaceae bacterium]